MLHIILHSMMLDEQMGICSHPARDGPLLFLANDHCFIPASVQIVIARARLRPSHQRQVCASACRSVASGLCCGKDSLTWRVTLAKQQVPPLQVYTSLPSPRSATDAIPICYMVRPYIICTQNASSVCHHAVCGGSWMLHQNGHHTSYM